MQKGREAELSRCVALYLTTLALLMALDFLFLGVLAKGFFVAEVGDMLGEVKPVPAVLFYLLYVAGVLVFVSGGDAAVHAALRRCSASFAMRPST